MITLLPLFGVLTLRSSKVVSGGSTVKLVVATEGKFGETGAGVASDGLPNSLFIHVHIAYLASPLVLGVTVTVACCLRKS